MSRWWSARNPLILTSVVCTVAVGMAAGFESVLSPTGGPPMLWWGAYSLFFLLLLAVHDCIPRPRRVSVDALLTVMLALGAVLVFLFSEQVWMALLFVLTAAVAAFFWTRRMVGVLIAVQTLFVVFAALAGGLSAVDLVVGTTVFGGSQAFSALVVFTARSEADARNELAVAHIELCSTTAQLEVATREAERLRIARDLHDLAGHHLAALSLELEVAAHLTEEGAGHEHVVRARSIAKDLLNTVRTAVGEMRTETPSLEPALRKIAADISNLDISVEVTGRVDLTMEQTVAILRCVQESITNTLRHSDAHDMHIRIGADGDEVRLVVTDDGGGVARIVPGHGVSGMQERFESLGGDLRIQSSLGAGFAIIGRLPHPSTTVLDGDV
ncbi:sensor histidine kinase [Nocardia rhamnosiphila]